MAPTASHPQKPLKQSGGTDPAVTATTLAYLPWAVWLPLIGVTSYVYDGIYVGATWTRALLVTMVAAFTTYSLVLWAAGSLGNHGLWLAFTLFFIARAAGQALLLPRLRRATFEA